MGLLKRAPGEWQVLQNLRGWGDRIKRRQGTRTSVTLDTGIMGIFDLAVDGDPLSPEKILVIGFDGTFNLYDFSELVSIFDYLFSTSTLLYLQSPDLNWWDVTPDSGTGIISPEVVAAPGTTITSDLNVFQNQLFGFLDSTGVWAISVGTQGSPVTSRYGLASGETLYTSTQAFESGFGPVFQDNLLTRWKLGINNAGALTTEVV